MLVSRDSCRETVGPVFFSRRNCIRISFAILSQRTFWPPKMKTRHAGPHFDEKWRVFFRLGEHMYIMIRYVSEEVEFAPLFLSSFALLAPHQLLEAEKFNLRFPDPSGITETADKLRWYRYKKALLQREAAAWIGVDCSTYQSYETVGRTTIRGSRWKNWLICLKSRLRNCWML